MTSNQIPEIRRLFQVRTISHLAEITGISISQLSRLERPTQTGAQLTQQYAERITAGLNDWAARAGLPHRVAWVQGFTIQQSLSGRHREGERDPLIQTLRSAQPTPKPETLR